MLNKKYINGWKIKNSAPNGFKIYRKTDYDEKYPEDPEETYEVIKCVGKPEDYKLRVLDRCHTKEGSKSGEIVEDKHSLTKEEALNFVKQYTSDHPA